MDAQLFADAYARIKDATGAKTQMDLAEIFGVQQSSISDAVRRHNIPAGWLVVLTEKYGLNPHWVKTGEGLRYLQPSTSAAPLSPLAGYGTDDLLAEIGRRCRVPATHLPLYIAAKDVERKLAE